ncbi:TSUP family transporter [Arsenicicoccus dermatophilus]|uniref:TSUP family transporter n=1 Tax=Arsenicicoccus dermatophilus TaxID=1076331 RepID=UPI003917654F
MTPSTFLLLVGAGVGAGVVGYLTGMASLVSFPAMLAAGLSPVAANVSQTIGLVGIGAGAAARSTSTLLAGGRRDLLLQLALSALGGLLGGGLLLAGGEGSFEAVVPWLVLVASVLVLLSPRLRAAQGGRTAPRWVYLAGVLAMSTYGGYFGAGAGTIYLAVALLASTETFARSMILKSVLLAVTNLVASVLFALSGVVHWWAAVALGLGCVAGGHLGAALQDHVPEPTIRRAVAVAGVGLAWWLAHR